MDYSRPNPTTSPPAPNRPTAGQPIRVRAFKANGTCYRHWQVKVTSVTEEWLETESKAGHEVWDRSGSWIGKFNICAVYWFDRPYNLFEIRDAQTDELIEIYINIGSPPRFSDGELHFTDYELDVVCLPGESARLVDEDEFAEAVETFGYSKDFQAACYQAAQEALTVANEWKR
ncbi:MAG: DUF402 domain-containing protein [Chloroflexota bacterium]